MHRYATTFEEHVQIMAIESPHALILEWGRRLDQALRNYRKLLGLRKRSWDDFMEALRTDPLVGQEVTAQIIGLRSRRNAVAHEKTVPISPDDAAQYAHKAEEIIWLLGEAQETEKRQAAFKENKMKIRGYYLSLFFGAMVLVGIGGCGQGEPAGKAAAPSAPAAPSKSVTESAGQAVVDTIKAPLDKSRAVEGTLEKAADKTADTIKDATQ